MNKFSFTVSLLFYLKMSRANRKKVYWGEMFFSSSPQRSVNNKGRNTMAVRTLSVEKCCPQYKYSIRITRDVLSARTCFITKYSPLMLQWIT
jgi:hypothetical protein